MSDIAPSAPTARPAAEETVPANEGRRCDPRLATLSAAVAGLVRDYGRSPTSATSWRLDEDCVVTALTDFMTPAEQVVVERGGAELVGQVRSAFVAAIEDEYRDAAEAALACQVIAHHSEIICTSNVCVEVFLLGGDAGRSSASPWDVDVFEA